MRRIAKKLQKRKMETASRQMDNTAAMPSPIKHLGGGWYEVNGQKVQGKEQAEQLLKEGG